MNEAELNAMGYVKKYDYTQYAHDNHINVIPEEAFKLLVANTFKTIADNLRNTYGPYGSTVLLNTMNETTATKDGYNVFNALGFNHQYKKMVYLAIKKIIDRVNDNVGDGTTSCILLAEKIFNKLNEIIKTPEDKRIIKGILDFIEHEIQRVDIDETGDYIKKLKSKNIVNLLMVAANYDPVLVSHLLTALNPVFDKEGNIKSINNVIVDCGTPHEVSQTSFEVSHYPGKYRVEIGMNYELALAFSKPRRVRVVLYDHGFGDSEWNYFLKNYDKKTDTVIIARGFTSTFMNGEYIHYVRGLKLAKADHHVFFIQLKGGYYQDEVKDLASVLNIKPHTVDDLEVNHEEIPFFDLSVYNYNCLCFYNVEPPVEYINNLKAEASIEESYAKKTLMNDRIEALNMDKQDSLIKVKAESSIEMKILTDKLDDCISIAKSAFSYGITPNLLWYGYRKLDLIDTDVNNFKSKIDRVINIIQSSIIDIAKDIYLSKHSNPSDDELSYWVKDIADVFYAGGDGSVSYDIIKDEFVDMMDLPTSAQYDVEIIVASLSIVKYLLSAKALIFDANIMVQQGDEGHFEQL